MGETMTKRAKAKGAKAPKVGDRPSRHEAREPVQARARARGPDAEVWAAFCKRVADGKVERVAAFGLGVPYTTIRSWMDAHPEMREQLLDARAVEIQRRLDRMEETPFSIGAGSGDGSKVEDTAAGGIHPKAAELMMKHDRWRLEGLDPEQFLPPKRVDTTLSGPDGGPVQSEVVRYEYRAPKNALLDGDE